MIRVGVRVCPKCGGDLKYYDTIRRKVLSKRRVCTKLYIRRFQCLGCGALHNEIPEVIFPYKHYEAEIIRGVQEGLITSNTLGFEDYPCESTMRSWISRKKQALI